MAERASVTWSPACKLLIQRFNDRGVVTPVRLEYRFIDRDLILWDPHADLIVDFIPNALALWES